MLTKSLAKHRVHTGKILSPEEHVDTDSTFINSWSLAFESDMKALCTTIFHHFFYRQLTVLEEIMH
jgi:hypothetical protein